MYNRMPRRSSSPPLVVDYKKNLPAVIVPQRPSFLQTMKEGVALGVGSSIGHRIIGSILGPAHLSGPSINNEYEQCMKDNNDKSACEYLLRT